MSTRKPSFIPDLTTHPRLSLGVVPEWICYQLSSAINDKKVFRQASYSIEELAFIVGTNRLYLSRIINLRFGMNFNQFINYCRVEYSKYLLVVDPLMSHTQIATESGFSSTAYFNRIFKAKVGLLPKEWREQELSKANFV